MFLDRTLICIPKLAPRATRARIAAAATAQQELSQSTPHSAHALLEQPAHPSSGRIGDFDSDSSIEFITALLLKSKMSATTCVIHNTYNHPPTVTEGELTPKLIMEFEQACHTFFDNAKGGVPDEQKVACILPTFKDPLICDWISSSRNELITLTFKDFMTELQCKQLPRNWEDKIRTQILSERLKPDIHFITWATRLQSLNCLLRGSSSHFSEQRICEQLEAGIDEELHILGCKNRVNETDSIRDFLDVYELCDAKRKITQQTVRSMIEESMHSSRKGNSTKENHPNSYHPYNKTSSSGKSGKHDRLAKLSDEEKDIIRKNTGCFKCRKLYVPPGHIAENCPDGFPTPEMYQMLSWEYVSKVKAACMNHVAKTTSSSAKLVASVGEPVVTTSASIIDANSLTDSDFIASIFGPLSQTSVVGNGSFSESDTSISLLTKSKHYVWKCSVDSPAVEFPIKTTSLIDNGAHIVLIHPDLVKKLGLKISLLPSPEVVDVALNSPTEKKTQKELTHFINFWLSSLDGLWTSRSVSAFIAPGLCILIILGLPFLERNKIVCDHEMGTCIHKPSSYDLLNPPERKPHSLPKPCLRDQIREVKQGK